MAKTATKTKATTESLPIFEDEEVRKSTMRITKAGDGLSAALDLEPKALHLGDEVCFVIRGTVGQVNHRMDEKDRVVRQHTVEVTGIAEVDPDMARSILTEESDRLSKLRDERTGQERIEDDVEF